jgi:hypothetical protein
MPRWMVLVITALIVGAFWFKWSRSPEAAAHVAAQDGHQGEREKMAESLAEMNKRMPIDVNPMVRITRMELVNGVALVYVTQSGIFEPTEDAKAAMTKMMKAEYCHGTLKQAYKANVSIEMDLKTPSRSLDEPFGKLWVLSVSPAQCG